MCTRLRGRINTRDGALLVGVVVPRFIDGIFERGRRFAVTRGACRQRSRRGKMTTVGKRGGKPDVCSEIIHRP